MWSLVARFVERLVDGRVGGFDRTVTAWNRRCVNLNQREKFLDRLKQIGGRGKEKSLAVGQALGGRIGEAHVGDDAVELVLDELRLRVIRPAGR